MNTEEIIEGYMGSTEVNSIYQGSELIWSKYKYLIGGAFTSPKNRIIRLNDDDSIDNTFDIGTGFNGVMFALNIDTINKKIYVAGSPTLEGGLVRYNLDGTKDNTFNIGTGFNNDVRSVIIDNTNSKIYVGGLFTIFNGSTQNCLVRLNMDGSKDTSFNIGTGFGDPPYQAVSSIEIDNINSKIYVGGWFTTFNGSAQNKLIRLNMNGSKDTSFNVGFDTVVASIKIDTINSKIYVGGLFTIFNGSTRNRLIRLNMNGSKDDTFNIGTGFNSVVSSIIIDNTNSKIYVGGSFTEYNGSTRNKLVRLNMNGSLDTSFNVGTGFSGRNEAPSNILVDNEKNKIYITGNFTTYNNQPQKYIARLNMNGSLDNTFNIQLNNAAHAILKYT